MLNFSSSNFLYFNCSLSRWLYRVWFLWSRALVQSQQRVLVSGRCVRSACAIWMVKPVRYFIQTQKMNDKWRVYLRRERNVVSTDLFWTYLKYGPPRWGVFMLIIFCELRKILYVQCVKFGAIFIFRPFEGSNSWSISWLAYLPTKNCRMTKTRSPLKYRTLNKVLTTRNRI